MNQQEKHKILQEFIKQTERVDLGPPPWDEVKLKTAYFRSFSKTRAKVKTHEGYRYHRDLEDLGRGLNLFRDAVKGLINTCETFRRDAELASFWFRANQAHYECRVRDIRMSLFTVISASMALVDTCRAVSRHVTVPGYDAQKKKVFVDWDVHHFIQLLRNYGVHRRHAEAHWQVAMTMHARETRFYLHTEDLLEFDGWNSQDKKYIKRHPEGIDPEALFIEYEAGVKDFHDWFHLAFAKAAEPALSEYRHYALLLDRWSSQDNWNMVLDLALTNNLDPYLYLDQYLTKQEMDQIQNLPNHSVEQVDRIIEVLDTYGACDEPLKNKIYKLFNVQR